MASEPPVTNPLVYLDHAATTPLDPRVRSEMEPWLSSACGNPSSLHSAGRRARAAIDLARERVARLIGAEPAEIVFTASGTEADNLALAGSVARRGGLVTSAIEHPAVIETARSLGSAGLSVSFVAPRVDGVVHPDDLTAALAGGAGLVSIMAANNVVGTVQPLPELARAAHAAGALFHTDAVQAAGKLPLEVRDAGIDLLSMSAHKMHGPQGVGALFVREGLELEPIVRGGGQERGRRSATENVAGIVGFGAAAGIAREEMAAEAVRLVVLRERILETLGERLPCAYLIGDRFRRLPGHLCLGLAGLENEAITLLLALDERGIAVSSGSACSSRHAGQPSHVLAAMGFDPIRARGSLRVTLGRFTTDEDVERFLDALPAVAAALRPVTSRPFHERSPA